MLYLQGLLKSRYGNASSPQKSFNIDIGGFPCLAEMMALSLKILIVITEARTFSFDVLMCMFKGSLVKL